MYGARSGRSGCCSSACYRWSIMVVTEAQTIAFIGTYQHGYRLVPLDRATGATGVTVAELSRWPLRALRPRG
jgi:hypothetical protein